MVNWTTIINNFASETIDFANGNLTLRDFQRSVSANPDAKSAVQTVAKVHRTEKGRKLAKRALQRRGLICS